MHPAIQSGKGGLSAIAQLVGAASRSQRPPATVKTHIALHCRVVQQQQRGRTDDDCFIQPAIRPSAVPIPDAGG